MEPVESAHPAHNYWHPGSGAGNPCGRTSDQESERKAIQEINQWPFAAVLLPWNGSHKAQLLHVGSAQGML